ncbi:MAG: hypothetical protein TH68_03500 [Candidatus Synechococcus spongiarum 142]|uniref:Uncharacterized protein n=1 Tax=Candidatus Synechococcus spongiarum 142 TaxID=1608213 RepID=A0A6N3XBP7_9SYNE|nr:MAG: hypothetical protein TH68_03500 [Candidatus Synechococcus spongiarum 142]
MLSDKIQKKCDGLFIFTTNKRNIHRIYIVLVELKGTDIYTAFQQLESVNNCCEYKKIIEHFNSKRLKVIEKSFIVTNAKVSPRLQQDKLEKSFGIKVDIRTSAQTKAKALNLRKYLNLL